MTSGFKELLKLAKTSRVGTYVELLALIDVCKNEITGADVDCVRQRLNIKMF
jgi:hypothetical protein